MNKSCFSEYHILKPQSFDALEPAVQADVLRISLLYEYGGLWLDASVPHVHSWDKYHPDALHVLWTDDDNDELIRLYYPHYYQTYKTLALVIQQCDFARLLYLHRYGGVYADLDYEAHTNIFEHLPVADIMVVESPVLLNETMQNSLMVSTVLAHPFWICATDSIIEIVKFVNTREACYLWGGVKPIQGCKMLNFFHNPFTKKIANVLFTMQISGACVLDKTYVRYRRKQWDLTLLNKEQWFFGINISNGICTHHQSNTWVSIMSHMPEITSLGAFLLLATILLTCVSTIYVYKMHIRQK